MTAVSGLAASIRGATGKCLASLVNLSDKYQLTLSSLQRAKPLTWQDKIHPPLQIRFAMPFQSHFLYLK
jgi:hypothetical protein